MKLLLILIVVSLRINAFDYFPLALNSTWTYTDNSFSSSFFAGSNNYRYGYETVSIVNIFKNNDTTFYKRQIVRRTDSLVETFHYSNTRKVDSTIKPDTLFDTLKALNNTVIFSANRICMKAQFQLGDTLVYDTLDPVPSVPGSLRPPEQIDILQIYTLIVADTGRFLFGDSLYKVFLFKEQLNGGIGFTKTLAYAKNIGFVFVSTEFNQQITDAGFGSVYKLSSYSIPSPTNKESNTHKPGSIQFDIYPNPFNTVITVKSKSSSTKELRIFSIDGRLLDKAITSSSFYTWKPGIQTKGTYILSITSENNTESKKIFYCE
ncbi:MAG: T9SS type A sorting domain-containing protein [Fibrobacteres bacterium]|nr:T9SS type A sorting domain-containing protein [Fibrobacterota bacterium]